MSETPRARCTATAIMPSGLYRCVYEEQHDEHYFAYARQLTPEERAKVGPEDEEHLEDSDAR
jgi:hypothetical protein